MTHHLFILFECLGSEKKKNSGAPSLCIRMLGGEIGKHRIVFHCLSEGSKCGITCYKNPNSKRVSPTPHYRALILSHLRGQKKVIWVDPIYLPFPPVVTYPIRITISLHFF